MRFSTTLADFESSTISAVLLNDHPRYSIQGDIDGVSVQQQNQATSGARQSADYVMTGLSEKPTLSLFLYI
jgi:hypothetical protein